jgi:hypothetical protein
MPFTPWLRILSAVVFRSTASGSKPTAAVDANDQRKPAHFPVRDALAK